jgi:tetratricopeptide (TPR) repeat protein
VNNCFKLMLVLLMALLVKPVFGLGQQTPIPTLESLAAAAQQAQAARDYATAVNDYKQAVKIAPNLPELWANLGLMQQEAGDIASAMVSLQHANRLNSSLYVPNLFLGIDFVRTHKAVEAIPYLLKAEKINKTDPQAPLALGRAYYAAGKFTAAARELERATVLDPKPGEAWFALGMARLSQVEEDARTLSTTAKDSPFAGALFAQSLEKQARFSEAATLYRSLLNAQPQPPCLHSELGFTLLRHRDLAGAAAEFASDRAAHPECSLALLGQVRIAIENSDNDRAATLLQQLWARDHGYIESNASLLLEGMTSERATEAVEALTQANSAIPADLRAALLVAFNPSMPAASDRAGLNNQPSAQSAESTVSNRNASKLYASGEFANCARQIDPALAAGRADKLKLLAACSYFAGDNDRASKAAVALAALQPHSPEALYWSIQSNQRLALQSLARFQQLESDSPRSHVLLGDIYTQLQRFDDAQAEYTKALALSPTDPAALLGLAYAYLSNNDADKALQAARLAMQQSPQDPEVNLVLADSLVVKLQFAEAEPYLLKSLTVKPQMLGHVHGLLGKVYAETGRPKEAIEQLKMAESSDESGSIHYLLARLYRQIGDVKDASLAIDEVKKIKQQRLDRGVKLVEDPDLSALESPPGQSSAP